MLPSSMSHYRTPIYRLCHHVNRSGLIYYPLRTYASSPKPRPYKSSNSIRNSTRDPKSAPLTKSSPIPLQPVLPVETPKSRINPPASTLPPPLTLPTRTLEDGTELAWYKYYYRLGRAYGGFYMAGLKAMWANFKSTQGLVKKLPSTDIATIRQAVNQGILSRADFQSIRRSKSDLSKLPPFILLWCICGEFTPLIIVFVTGLVPRILWIPKQVQQAREKAEERRKTIRSKSKYGEKPLKTIIKEDLRTSSGSTSREAYRYVAQSLGLYSGLWDRFAPSVIPPGLLQQRVNARLKDLEVDDYAISRDGGVTSMSDDEVKMACEERGIGVLGKEDEILKKELEGWLQHRTSKSLEASEPWTGIAKSLR